MPPTTVYEYFDILRDTLVLHDLPAWRQSKKRKPLVSSKYYFFDVGVVSSLQGRQVRARTPEFGSGFESYVMHELKSYVEYTSGEPLAFWRPRPASRLISSSPTLKIGTAAITLARRATRTICPIVITVESV
ncbi:MAG TPA: DUF4143 domain-containing protein [Vicinamibacterales bacterium]|nr:DUF4143 domain-containing protein [Vicinamibacterales bacterium]